MSHAQPRPPEGRMDTEDVKHSTSVTHMKKPHNNVMVTMTASSSTQQERSLMCCVYVHGPFAH